MKLTNKNLIVAILDKIPLLLRLITITFKLSVAMSLLFLLFTIFTVVVYKDVSQTPELFLIPYWIVAFGNFYIIFFATIPGFLIALLVYFVLKWKFQRHIKIKPYLKLFAWNICVVLAIFLIVFLNYPNNQP